MKHHLCSDCGALHIGRFKKCPCGGSLIELDWDEYRRISNQKSNLFRPGSFGVRGN